MNGVRLGLVALVSGAWAASFVTSLLNPDYHPDPSVNAAFTVVLGVVLLGRPKKGDDE